VESALALNHSSTGNLMPGARTNWTLHQASKGSEEAEDQNLGGLGVLRVKSKTTGRLVSRKGDKPQRTPGFQQAGITTYHESPFC
jgi:hypothetical protein